DIVLALAASRATSPQQLRPRCIDRVGPERPANGNDPCRSPCPHNPYEGGRTMFGRFFANLWRREHRPMRRPNRFRAQLEQLEDRCVPSTLGGLYSINFTAADPTTYQHFLPGEVKCPMRRTTNDPIVGADYGDPTVPVNPPRVSLTSLAPPT